MDKKKIKKILTMVIPLLFFVGTKVVSAGKSESCQVLLGRETDEIIKTGLAIMTWAVPTIAIVYTIIETFKAVAEGTAESIREYVKRFGKRMIIVILVILLPSLLDLVFKAFGLEYCAF